MLKTEIHLYRATATVTESSATAGSGSLPAAEKSAARPTRGSSPVQQQFDPLSMSDEEFSKLDINKLFR